MPADAVPPPTATEARSATNPAVPPRTGPGSQADNQDSGRNSGHQGPANGKAVAVDQGRWRPPLLWRFVLWLAGWVIPTYVRLRVTGDVPAESRQGPLILAGNHISPFDPIAFTGAARRRRLAPRMMATGGLFRAPVIGRLMAAAGHIPVDRGRSTVADVVPTALAAIEVGSVVFIYPEGRIGLDPGMWPERAKTGLARLALATRAPVVPVAIWGSHEVTAYHGWRVMLSRGISALWRRPTVRIHFGAPVDLSDLTEGTVGHAQRASDRIMDAITRELARLREDEPRLPRFRDHTRPLSTARTYRRAPYMS